jgi:hypothetical protein
VHCRVFKDSPLKIEGFNGLPVGPTISDTWDTVVPAEAPVWKYAFVEWYLYDDSDNKRKDSFDTGRHQ